MGRLSGFRYREIVRKLKACGFEFDCQAAGMVTAREDDIQAVVRNRVRGYRSGAHGGYLNCHVEDPSYKYPGGGLISECRGRGSRTSLRLCPCRAERCYGNGDSNR